MIWCCFTVTVLGVIDSKYLKINSVNYLKINNLMFFCEKIFCNFDSLKIIKFTPKFQNYNISQIINKF
jgi:hypothetical protein